jgi:hypothetical protein
MIEWLIKNKLGEATHALVAAASCGQLELAKRLYNKYRQEIRASLSISGRTMVCAAQGGHLATVKWLVDTFGGEPDIELFITTQRPSLETNNSVAMDTAARNGRLAVLVYLHEVAEATSMW